MTTRSVLTLVRHGETSANIDGVWHGSTDTPLTDRGRAQASRVAAYIGAHHRGSTALYSSPLQRAFHTAQAIGQQIALDPVVDAGLAEFDLGSWEGKHYSELFEVHRLWHHMKEDADFAPHGGESPRQVTDRFVRALRSIAERHTGERVIIVAHGGALSMGLGALLDGAYGEWRRVMDNCALSELTLDPEPELLSFNQVTHLEGL